MSPQNYVFFKVHWVFTVKVPGQPIDIDFEILLFTLHITFVKGLKRAKVMQSHSIYMYMDTFLVTRIEEIDYTLSE